MIRIEVRRDAQGHISGYTVAGHSGYAPEGKDIVCAGVTALAEAAVLWLRQVAGVRPQVEMAEGLIRCELPALTGGQAAQAQTILGTMLLGLRDIAKDYRTYVQVSELKGGH